MKTKPKHPRPEPGASANESEPSKPKQTRAPRQTPGLPHQRINALKVNGLGIKPEPKIIDGEELAYRWRVQKSTIKWYVRRGLLKPVKLLSSRRLKFEFSEIRRIEAEAGVGQQSSGTLK